MNMTKAISIGIIIVATIMMGLINLLNPTMNHLDLLLYAAVALILVPGVYNASEHGIFAG